MHEKAAPATESMLRFMSIRTASRTFCIGEKKLRQLVADGEIEHVCHGNRKLVTTKGIYEWYDRTKTPASSTNSKD